MPDRGQEKLTVLLIPHSARPMASLNLSSRAVQACCVLLILVFLSLTIFAGRYAQMTAHLHELRDLRLLSQLQDEKLRTLTASADELAERLQQLTALDTELRQMLKLEAPGETGEAQDLMEAKHATVARAAPAAAPAVTVAPRELAVEPSILAGTGLLAGTLDILGAEMESRLASLSGLQIAAAEKLAYDAARPSLWPVRGRITSGYGYRRHPIGSYRQFHAAVDISAPLGTPIVATGDGRVIFTGWKTDLGNTLMIDHGYNFRTLYGHLAKAAVSVGDRVKKGQVIAYVGSTGQSTGPHVHYEVHLRGSPVNPNPYLR